VEDAGVRRGGFGFLTPVAQQNRIIPFSNFKRMNLKLLKIAGVQIVTLFVLGMAALIAYAWYAEERAENKARLFCETEKEGASTENLMGRAIEAGADARQTRWFKRSGEPDWLPVTFTGALPLSRHICSIRSTDGKLSEARYVYLD
jgi:hypothetical protein